MRLNRLYTKFLLSFLAVLIITEALVLVLFVVVPGKRFSARLEQFSRGKALLIKELVEEKIRSAPGVEWSDNPGLREFISDFGKVLDAKIWLSGKDGTVFLKSFPESIPPLVREIEEQGMQKYGGFKLFRPGRFRYYYAVVPVDLSQVRVGSLHVLLDQHAFPPPKGYFLSGLLVLGLVIAVAMIPVSRLITRRLKKLRQSAIRISEGDLSHRARIPGSDEVAELAGAFNGMTDKLEGMILSGKELVANVSHELRSPLTRIRLAEEMLREKLVQAGVGGWTGNLDAVREEVDELDTLIGRILELSKLNLRESPLRFEPMDPSDLIRDLLERLRPAMDRKGLRLEARLTCDPPFMGDRETLRSALINVLENAVRFTSEKGDISVHMEWMRESLGISIVNTFERLSDGDLALLFHPFHRRKGSAAPSGHGLGLTIARRAIERHGGTVVARNAEKGFEISISLPRRPGCAEN